MINEIISKSTFVILAKWAGEKKLSKDILWKRWTTAIDLICDLLLDPR